MYGCWKWSPTLKFSFTEYVKPKSKSTVAGSPPNASNEKGEPISPK